MKHNINRILMAGAAALVATAASAQNNTTAYFLDGYTYGYQMNPAKANDKGFFAFPALGNLNVGLNSNLDLTNFIYNIDGRTTTFLNPKVDANEFLDKIGDNTTIGTNVDIPLIAFGFKAFGGYNTVTLSAKADVAVKLPGALLRLAKEGVSNDVYNIGALKANAMARVDLALNHSHQITKDIRVGATLKAIVGGARAKLDMKHADLDLGENEWRIVTEGEAEVNLKGTYFETDRNNSTGNMYIDGINTDDLTAPSGIGFGVDLGAIWNPSFLPELTVSAAVLDLGFISWSETLLGSTKGEHVFTTDKYTFNVDDNAPNSFDNEFDKLGDDITALYELYDMGNQGSKTTGLGTTFNIGAEYAIPVYKPLTVGLLNTTRLQENFSWTEVRAIASWEPCKVFDAAVSAGVGTFGAKFGWIANLHAPGFNLFLGMNSVPTKLAKQGVPLNTGSVNFGINFLF